MRGVEALPPDLLTQLEAHDLIERTVEDLSNSSAA
jgi:hypothetical protein